jgi:hypothetical protein
MADEIALRFPRAKRFTKQRIGLLGWGFKPLFFVKLPVTRDRNDDENGDLIDRFSVDYNWHKESENYSDR